MLESSPSCRTSIYSHIVHSPEGTTFVTPQLNYITYIVLKLRAELAKLRLKLRELRSNYL